MDKRVQTVIECIKADFHRELFINEAAQHVNLSSSHLRHLFKAEVGMSPVQYHKSARLEMAKLLLESSFMRVKEIMAYVGIGDESHFTRDFKKVYGQTPAQYRANRLNNGNKKSVDAESANK